VIADQLRRNGVRVVRGAARFTDPHTLAVAAANGNGSLILETDRVVIAVGTRPAPPPGVAVDGTTVVTSDEIVCLDRIPKNMVVVGAGGSTPRCSPSSALR
jgi:NAD(P) transhydrogenase